MAPSLVSRIDGSQGKIRRLPHLFVVCQRKKRYYGMRGTSQIKILASSRVVGARCSVDGLGNKNLAAACRRVHPTVDCAVPESESVNQPIKAQVGS